MAKKRKDTLEKFVKLPEPQPEPLNESSLMIQYLEKNTNSWAGNLEIKDECLFLFKRLLAVKTKQRVLIIRMGGETWYSDELERIAAYRDWIVLFCDFTGWQYESKQYRFYDEVVKHARRYIDMWDRANPAGNSDSPEEEKAALKKKKRLCGRVEKFRKLMEHQYRIRLLEELSSIREHVPNAKTVQEVVDLKNRCAAFLENADKTIGFLEELRKLSRSNQEPQRARA
jgi:hypothetical protein